MTTKLLAIVLLFLLTGPAVPQQALSQAAPRSVLKFNPLPLADPYAPGASVSWQHRLSASSHFFLENELGVLFPTGWSAPNVTRDLRGLRLRTSLHYYPKPLAPGQSANFIGLMSQAQWSTRTVTADFLRQSDSFRQQIRYEHQQTVLALYFTIGATNWWRSERFVTDFGFGAGPRYVVNSPIALPADTIFTTNGTLFIDHLPHLDRWTMGMVFLFRIGWVLNVR